MKNHTIDIAQLSLPNAYSSTYYCDNISNSLTGFIIDHNGKILDINSELPDGTDGYYLIYDDKDSSGEFIIPDFTIQKPTYILRVRLNAANRDVQLKIKAFFDFFKNLFAPLTKLLTFKSDADLPQIIGFISTWNLTSPVAFYDHDFQQTFETNQVKLVVSEYSRGNKSAAYGVIMIEMLN